MYNSIVLISPIFFPEDVHAFLLFAIISFSSTCFPKYSTNALTLISFFVVVFRSCLLCCRLLCCRLLCGRLLCCCLCLSFSFLDRFCLYSFVFNFFSAFFASGLAVSSFCSRFYWLGLWSCCFYRLFSIFFGSVAATAFTVSAFFVVSAFLMSLSLVQLLLQLHPLWLLLLLFCSHFISS